MLEDMRVRHTEDSQKYKEKVEKELNLEEDEATAVLDNEKARKLRQIKDRQAAELAARAKDMNPEEMQQVSKPGPSREKATHFPGIAECPLGRSAAWPLGNEHRLWRGSTWIIKERRRVTRGESRLVEPGQADSRHAEPSQSESS